MNAPFLERVILRFPAKGDPFGLHISQWMRVLGSEKPRPPHSLALAQKDRDNKNFLLQVKPSQPDYHPMIWLDFFANELAEVRVEFELSSGAVYSVELVNTTGENRQSPHAYFHITAHDFIQRLAQENLSLVGIDHAGCNLPWFAAGLHPQIAWLRDQLSKGCLYHLFPTGEAWDFILPGDTEEIRGQREIDYSKTRRPKFEIVSFEKSSTALVQFDVQLNASYEQLLGLFPEALNDPNLRNLWIYLENPYSIDVCVVANPYSPGDWSEFFKASRLASC
jgi:hypothetical protein